MRCLLEMLYATGLRVSELVALPRTAARDPRALLIVRGKGGKERLVPLTEAARDAAGPTSRCSRGRKARRPGPGSSPPTARAAI